MPEKSDQSCGDGIGLCSSDGIELSSSVKCKEEAMVEDPLCIFSLFLSLCIFSLFRQKCTLVASAESEYRPVDYGQFGKDDLPVALSASRFLRAEQASLYRR
jgi:hypothetical protein